MFSVSSLSSPYLCSLSTQRCRSPPISFCSRTSRSKEFTGYDSFRSSSSFLVSIRSLPPPHPPAYHVLTASLSLLQGAYTKNEPEAIKEVWSALLDLFAKKKVRGIVYDKVFGGLEAVPTGLKALGARETWGKAVVKVSEESGKSKL